MTDHIIGVLVRNEQSFDAAFDLLRQSLRRAADCIPTGPSAQEPDVLLDVRGECLLDPRLVAFARVLRRRHPGDEGQRVVFQRRPRLEIRIEQSARLHWRALPGVFFQYKVAPGPEVLVDIEEELFRDPLGVARQGNLLIPVLGRRLKSVEDALESILELAKLPDARQVLATKDVILDFLHRGLERGQPRFVSV